MGLREECRGNWKEILSAIGIPYESLTGKCVPCPVCGGSDRFVFDDKNGEGGWFCRHCGGPSGCGGAGNGLKLVQKFLGVDWEVASDRVRQVLGKTRHQKKIEASGSSDLDKYNRMSQVWSECVPVGASGLVARYLGNRGLQHNDRLGFHPSLYWGEDGIHGYAPAMVARVISYDDLLVGIHRTYLDPETGGKANIPKPKKLMQSLPGLMGGAIRLSNIGEDGILGIAEGIETALSASLLNDVPVWSCVSANGIEQFIPPKAVRLLMVFADNDDHAVGQLAAFRLKARLHKLGISCEVVIPTENDWNDCLIKKTRE